MTLREKIQLGMRVSLPLADSNILQKDVLSLLTILNKLAFLSSLIPDVSLYINTPICI
jgi:hypothetical protein